MPNRPETVGVDDIDQVCDVLLESGSKIMSPNQPTDANVEARSQQQHGVGLAGERREPDEVGARNGTVDEKRNTDGALVADGVRCAKESGRRDD